MLDLIFNITSAGGSELFDLAAFFAGWCFIALAYFPLSWLTLAAQRAVMWTLAKPFDDDAPAPLTWLSMRLMRKNPNYATSDDFWEGWVMFGVLLYPILCLLNYFPVFSLVVGGVFLTCWNIRQFRLHQQDKDIHR